MSKEVNEFGSGEKVFNTRRLQMFELCSFMNNEHEAVFDGVGFTAADSYQQYSFAQAVEMFNSRELGDMDEYLIERVKLRYCKRKKSILCTNHLIKLTQGITELCEEYGEDPSAPLYEIMKSLRLR